MNRISESQLSVFKRIGGKKVVDAIIDIYFDKLVYDDELSDWFKSVDLEELVVKLKLYVPRMLGSDFKVSEQKYHSFIQSFHQLNLSPSYYDRASHLLEESLDQMDFNMAIRTEILEIINTTLGIESLKRNKKNTIKSNNMIKNDETVQDKKSAPKKLKGSQSKANVTVKSKETIDFYQVLEGSVMCVVIIDDRGTIEFFNESSEKLWGYNRNEVIGKNVKMLTPVDIQAEHDDYLLNYNNTGKRNVMGGSREVKALRKDGEEVNILLSLSESVSGGNTKYTAFIQDISAQKKMEREMQESEEELRAQEEELRQNLEEIQATQEEMERINNRNLQILEQAIDAVVTIDGAKNVIFYNYAAERMFGYTKEEVLGQNVRMIVPIEHRANHDNYVDRNVKTGENKVVGKGRELEMTRKDGTKFWGHLALSKVEVEGEFQFTAFIKDVTEARNLRERNYQILEQAVDSVVTIDQDKMITFFNTAAEKMFGYQREEVIGKNVSMIVPMEHRGQHDNYVNSNIKTGINKVVGQGRDLEMVSRDGTKFWGNLSLSKVNVDDTIQYTAFIKDITQTKHNEFAFQKVIDSIGQIRNGNFDFEIDFDGLHLDESLIKVSEDLNLLKENLKNILSEVNKVVNLAGNEGKLNSRLDLQDTHGAWKELVDSINALLQSVAEPILEFDSIISKMAQGDLTTRFEMKTNGDIKKMAESLNTAIHNLNDLLGSIGDSTNVVASSADGLNEMSKSMKHNTTEVASAISQMAKGAQDQAAKTDESSKLAGEVMSSATEMETKANLINKAAESGKKSCEQGLKIITNLVENMNGITSSAGLTSDSIKILTERAEEIGRTLNVITDIAAQTNLLALNAAIEAARAGDAGRGFAVVAEEIRKLAEDSRKSAVDIEKIIGDVQKDTQSASKAIDNMEGSVKNGNAATKEAEVIFNEISNSSDDTFNYSKEIQEGSILQKQSIDMVVKNIEQIVVVAEETAAGTQQVASSSQELDGSMKQISDNSNRLSEVASKLKAGLNQFKLKNNGSN